MALLGERARLETRIEDGVFEARVVVSRQGVEKG
jgi:hypothetical protein